MGPAESDLIDAYWRAANYLAVGQIYLLGNPLVREPLELQHIKPRLLGHWGTTPGLNFVYAHLNRVIRPRDLDMIYVAGPGHGGPGMVANVYLEGTYSEVYPNVSDDTEGMLGPDCGRVVIAHLGSGASMAAVHDGLPIDTTMAFTPTAGLMMGTRTGDLDPGIIVHLLRDHGMNAGEVEHLVNNESGLRGVSGSTADVRSLLEAGARDARADRAITMFGRTARKAIGALAAVLGGIDQLVFTGGIGEHAPVVRAEICAGLEYLGVVIDPERNARNDAVVSAADARCGVRTITACEDVVIARHTAALIGSRGGGGRDRGN